MENIIYYEVHVREYDVNVGIVRVSTRINEEKEKNKSIQ